MSLLEITGLTHSFGENLLYKNAGFTLNKMEHIGIVGQNGTGKSTLIKICTEQIIPDSGRVIWQPNITIGYLDQYAEIDHTLTVKEFLKSAFAKLFEIETQVMQLYEKAADGDMKNLELAAYYQEQLETHDFYSIDTAIERVANGLGLLAIGLDRPIIEMSGGQRAKVILAKLLLEKPDVLLLDEPTNFLDKDHVAWLAEYLSSLENAFLVVSHDFDFLDKIANRICDIDNDTITKYYGTYSEFLRKKTLLREDYIRQYSAQQKEIKKTEEFIRKNIAGRKAKMARGRQKQLDRMDKMEALEQKEIIPHFHFPVLPLTNTEHLLVKHLAVGYHYPGHGRQSLGALMGIPSEPDLRTELHNARNPVIFTRIPLRALSWKRTAVAQTSNSEEEAAAMLYAKNSDDSGGRWIMGGAWDNFRWPGTKLPTRESLDRYFKNTPVFLLNKECHGAWLNSEALRRFSITRDTLDPENGSYFRDADGEPTGYVHEAAVIPMLRSILSEMSMEELSGYAEAFAKTAGRCGITSVGDLPLYGVRAEPAYRILEDKESSASG